MPKLAGDHVQVLVDGYELTGDSNRISINDSRDLFDITAFGDEAHKFSPGQRMMALQHAGFINSAEGGSHPVLQGAAVDGLFSLYLAGTRRRRRTIPSTAGSFWLRATGRRS